MNTPVNTTEIWSTKSVEFVVVAVLLGSVSIIGILGNGLVLAVIATVRKTGHKSSVQLFIIHLAISDLFVCILCIPMTIFSNFHYPTSSGVGDVVLCKFVRFVQFVSPTISIAVLTIISIDRFLSLARPVLSKAPRIRIFRPSWLIAFAWLYSTIQFLPTFYFSSLMPINISNTTIYYCTPIPNKSMAGKTFLIFIFFASFVVPVSTMSVLYYRVIRVVWNRQRKLSIVSSMAPTEGSTKIIGNSRRKVTRMLLSVVVVFFICWTPFVVYSGFIEERLKGFPNPFDAVRVGLYGLGLFNSICNPFIYYFNGGNLNPRVLIENERRRRSSSVSSNIYRMNSARRSASAATPGMISPNGIAEAKPKGSQSSSTTDTPQDCEPVFLFTPEKVATATTKETDL